MKKLSRTEMKHIMGGDDSGGGGGDQCRMTYTNASGGTSTYTTSFSGTCSQQSASANTACVNILTQMNASGDSCSYDCGCDGWGQ